MKIARSILAVLLGLVLISILVEAIEFALVALVNGGSTTDPVVYFGIRNRPWFLALKLVYNTAGAIAGGLAAAWIAGRSPRAHGIALAAVQAAALAYAVTDPAMRLWTPDWMWAALIVVSTVGVIWGARLRERHSPPLPAGGEAER
jgi:hypothetical protein